MRKKTSGYILLSLILSSLMICPMYAFAQNKKDNKKEKTEKAEFYQGTTIGLEVAGLGNHVLGSDILSSEVMLQANLLNRFLPVIELGYGKVNTLSDATDIHYRTSAPFFKIGADYNFFYNKPHLPGYLFGGLRYGFSSFVYDVDAPTMTDPNYGGQIQMPFSYHGVNTTAHWLEIVAGMKVKIYKGFCMGWSVKYKKRLSYTKHENTEPWYIPGFGENAGTGFSLSYHLMYDLPF